jgi:hypothetical protein
MKPVSRWVTLGMSLSIVICIRMIAPVNAENLRASDGATLGTFAGIKQQPKNGTPPTQFRAGPLTTTVFIDGSGELFVENPARQSTQSLIKPDPALNDVNTNPLDSAKPKGLNILDFNEMEEIYYPR